MKLFTIIVAVFASLSCAVQSSLTTSECQLQNRQISIALNVFVSENILEIKDDQSILVNTSCTLEKPDDIGRYKIILVGNRPKETSRPYVFFSSADDSQVNTSSVFFRAYQYGYRYYGTIFFSFENGRVAYKNIDYVSAIE